MIATILLAASMSTSAMTADSPWSVIPAMNPQPEPNARRFKEKAELVKKGGAKYVFIGDSITHYWEIGEGEDDSREILELEKRYRHMNCGYGGEWTENLIWRMKNGELDGCKIKVLSVQIGTNNFFWPNKPEDVASGIFEAVRLVREKHPETKVILTSCFPRSQGRAPTLEKVNACLARAADGKCIFYLDIYEKFLHPDGKLRVELFTDRLHPSAAGYRVWLDELVPVVDKLLGGK